MTNSLIRIRWTDGSVWDVDLERRAATVVAVDANGSPISGGPPIAPPTLAQLTRLQGLVQEAREKAEQLHKIVCPQPREGWRMCNCQYPKPSADDAGPEWRPVVEWTKAALALSDSLGPKPTDADRPRFL